MVKITNGKNVFEVTSGAYEKIYKHQGYQVIDKPNRAKQDFVPEELAGETKTADEMFVEELQEKPISQWNKDEVKRYAAIMDIDIKGTKSVNDAKDIIKAAMATGEGEV